MNSSIARNLDIRVFDIIDEINYSTMTTTVNVISTFFLGRANPSAFAHVTQPRTLSRFYWFYLAVIRLAIPDKIDNNVEPAGFAASGVTKCCAKTEMRIINGN